MFEVILFLLYYIIAIFALSIGKLPVFTFYYGFVNSFTARGAR